MNEKEFVEYLKSIPEETAIKIIEEMNQQSNRMAERLLSVVKKHSSECQMQNQIMFRYKHKTKTSLLFTGLLLITVCILTLGWICG